MEDFDKTIPPRREHISSDADDVTMPGRRDRKPDGRFAVGDLIMGRYKVLAELGQGGMGVVYKCFDETAGIEVALKALPPELSHNSYEMEDVKENFQLVHNLHHPNIACYNNLERDNANGNYYLIMEYCDGEDLRRWMRRKRREGGITLETVIPVIQQIAAALDYAHEMKIIHRDIKPGNIMIDHAGKIKVLDFGLAAQIHTSMTRVSMAYHGTSGTGPYMAPEQWRGRAQKASADQYALAVLTYEMLAGNLPFESPDAAVLREAVLNDTPEDIADIPQSVQETIKRAMSKEPAERFASCSDFATALADKEFTNPQSVAKESGNNALMFGISAADYLKQQELKRAKEEAERQQTNVVVDCNGTPLEMINIKAGSFLMGSPENETFRHTDEKLHLVTLTQNYWLGKFAVTQAQWQAVMGNNPSVFKGDNHPVENVNWNKVKEFCNRLNERYAGKLPAGYKFDLPTEAQWEYACRAGTTTALNNNSDLNMKWWSLKCSNLDTLAWYDSSSSRTRPVGQKQANAWGLYDMHGNVWEWCRNWYGSYSGDATDPDGPSSGIHRVCRGGSWYSEAKNCRSANRGVSSPGDRSCEIGFRLALVPVQ